MAPTQHSHGKIAQKKVSEEIGDGMRSLNNPEI